MALKHDSFFSLSKGERRATLALLLVVLLLASGRLVQQCCHQRAEKVVVEMDTTFRSEIKEFNRSLQTPVSKGETRQKKERKNTVKPLPHPKELKPVPREG